jgi:hypothetical protein
MGQTKQKAPALKPFDFWRDNLLAGYFQLTAEELQTKFVEWKQKQKPEWYTYYYGVRAVLSFLGDKDGLSATHEADQFDDIYAVLKPCF